LARSILTIGNSVVKTHFELVSMTSPR